MHEDLKNKNKALLAKIDDLNKANALALFDLFKASEEKKELRSHVNQPRGFHSKFDYLFNFG